MISAVCWVPRGVAQPVELQSDELTEEELAAMEAGKAIALLIPFLLSAHDVAGLFELGLLPQTERTLHGAMKGATRPPHSQEVVPFAYYQLVTRRSRDQPGTERHNIHH